MPCETSFTLDAGHSEFFKLACDIVATQQAAQQAHRTGVCWSGMQPDAPAVEAVEDVEARLQSQHDAREAFFKTPRGQFLRAVNSLGTLGFNEAETLLNICSRSLSDERQPLDSEAVGRALRILAEIRHSHAIEAIRALSDLLAPPLARAA